MTDQPTPLPPARIKPAAERHRDVAAIRRRNALAAVLALVLVGGTVWGLAAAQEASRQPADRYTTVVAERGSVTQRLSATGTVEKVNDAFVHFPAAGTVIEVPASVGDTVKAGDVLAVMDDASLRTQVLQAQADVDAAVLALKQIRDAADAATSAGAGTTGGSSGNVGLSSSAGSLGSSFPSGSSGSSGSASLPDAPVPMLDLTPLQAALTEADAAAGLASTRQDEADAAFQAMLEVCDLADPRPRPGPGTGRDRPRRPEGPTRRPDLPAASHGNRRRKEPGHDRHRRSRGHGREEAGGHEHPRGRPGHGPGQHRAQPADAGCRRRQPRGRGPGHAVRRHAPASGSCR